MVALLRTSPHPPAKVFGHPTRVPQLLTGASALEHDGHDHGGGEDHHERTGHDLRGVHRELVPAPHAGKHDTVVSGGRATA
jgi:hypothetical protein